MGDVPSANLVAGDLLANYYTLASFVILYYDYVLTFSMEIQRFWSQRTFSWALFFFYLNRYLSLLGHIPMTIEYFLHRLSDAHDPCRQLQTYHQYFAIAIQLVVGVLLIMRVYALYSQSRAVLVFLCITAACVVAFGCWAIMSGKKTNMVSAVMSDTGCPNRPLTKTESVRFAAAWGGLLLFDIIVFGMTVARALKVGRTGGRTLINVLLRDGAVYFLVMCLANLSNILTFVLGGPLIRGMGSTFTNVISTVMISRLMLNLRSPSLNWRKASTSTGSAARLTTNQPFVPTVVEHHSHETDFEGQMRFPETNSEGRPEKDGGGTPDIELVPRSVSRNH